MINRIEQIKPIIVMAIDFNQDQVEQMKFSLTAPYLQPSNFFTNIDGTIWHTIKTRKLPRHGTQCVILYPTNRNPAQSLQENAITVFGPLLYNSLPIYLRYIKSVKTEKFKFELDKFLDTINDQPKMPNYVTAS